jgi:UDP-N-acetylmuramate dehydrogenase
MQLHGRATALTEAHNKEELLEALEWAKEHNLPVLLLGGGSNVIFTQDYKGLIIINEMKGFRILNRNQNTVKVQVGAGENWDEIVSRTVAMGLSGLEKLSLIPGTAGATPVQNVGAYGAEIADVFIELEAYDLTSKSFVTLDKAACHFSYRNSIFKSLKDRRYIITSITLRLSTMPPEPPFYESLQKVLDNRRVRIYTPQVVRDAVIIIRTVKLPNPKRLPNTGSFFKNPIVSKDILQQLQTRFVDIKYFSINDQQVKLSAGWLIDNAGLKGYTSHGMRIYEKNALVFINDSAQTYADLAAFRQEIVDKIYALYGIRLEQEPELIG